MYSESFSEIVMFNKVSKSAVIVEETLLLPTPPSTNRGTAGLKDMFDIYLIKQYCDMPQEVTLHLSQKT